MMQKYDAKIRFERVDDFHRIFSDFSPTVKATFVMLANYASGSSSDSDGRPSVSNLEGHEL